MHWCCLRIHQKSNVRTYICMCSSRTRKGMRTASDRAHTHTGLSHGTQMNRRSAEKKASSHLVLLCHHKHLFASLIFAQNGSPSGSTNQFFLLARVDLFHFFYFSHQIIISIIRLPPNLLLEISTVLQPSVLTTTTLLHFDLSVEPNNIVQFFSPLLSGSERPPEDSNKIEKVTIFYRIEIYIL